MRAFAAPPTDVMNGFPWELHDIDSDWSQVRNVAADNPDKLRDMQQIFTMEAQKYNVFPLDDRALPRFLGVKPSYTFGRTKFTYTGEVTNVPFPGVAGAPSLLNRSDTITAEVEIPEGGAEGMLVTDGGKFAGYGFYLLAGKPVFAWDLIQLDTVTWLGAGALAPAKHRLAFDWKQAEPGLGKGGTGTLSVDGTVVATKDMARTLPVGIGWVETFNVGIDTGTPVVPDSAVPFPFTGTFERLTVSLGPEELAPAEQEMIYGRTRANQ
jgi:arylsulfatase